MDLKSYLEEYNELRDFLNEQDRIAQKFTKNCMCCLFFEERKNEKDISLRYWCKFMPTSIKKSPFDYCGQFKER